jgi:hypothetical protein
VSQRSLVIEDPTDAALTGLPFLTIEATPQQMEARAGVAWTTDETELGPSLLSRFRVGTAGPRFSLRFFPEARHPGIVVSGDVEATDADVDALLAFLGVADEEIVDRVPVTGPRRDRRSTSYKQRPSSAKKTKMIRDSTK